MKGKSKKKFDINRVRQFCKLVNEGNDPNAALRKMSTCVGYYTPLKEAGMFWKENGTYKAVERIHTERYLVFLEKKLSYNKFYRSEKTLAKQASLFNQPKPKQTTPAPTMKAKEQQLTFVQRVVKSLFNL